MRSNCNRIKIREENDFFLLTAGISSHFKRCLLLTSWYDSVMICNVCVYWKVLVTSVNFLYIKHFSRL